MNCWKRPWSGYACAWRSRTWDAFRLTALEGLSGAEAAGRLGMKVAAVYVARSEVQKRLRDEVRRLEGADPP